MKKDIHPEVYPVVFVDTSSGAEFVTTSTVKSEETRDIDGVTHFVVKTEISSASHPFFTGEQRFVDTSGRVDKFKEKMEKIEAAKEARKGKKAKRAARAAAKQEEETVEAPKATKEEKKEEPKAEEAPVEEKKEEVAVEETPAVEATEEVTTEETPAEAEKTEEAAS